MPPPATSRRFRTADARTVSVRTSIGSGLSCRLVSGASLWISARYRPRPRKRSGRLRARSCSSVMAPRCQVWPGRRLHGPQYAFLGVVADERVGSPHGPPPPVDRPAPHGQQYQAAGERGPAGQVEPQPGGGHQGPSASCDLVAQPSVRHPYGHPPPAVRRGDRDVAARRGGRVRRDVRHTAPSGDRRGRSTCARPAAPGAAPHQVLQRCSERFPRTSTPFSDGSDARRG